MIRRIACALCGSLVVSGCSAPDAEDLFVSGRYREAQREYRQALSREPGSPIVHYDLGATAIRLREYPQARPHLEIASRTGDPRLRQWAHYNIGNTHLEPVALDLSDERETDLVRAIVAYKRALLLDPKDHDAKWNLEVARRMLEREAQLPRPRQDPRSGGGGGGGGEGGGGGGDADPGRADPRQQPTAGTGRAPDLSRTQAEQILDSAEERELGIQREKLKRAQPPVVSH